ncbi:hypothetical protein QFC20_007424 [Naganishia adeliensis]|uniref:Uncharacterized protein n=1 Tax=Naganishia adeliensis TaxID=92952 RepID=A0ACC2UZZ2_9TREE|nr:hypothetical protein QFC20_007424 [Naganishia adeliensis]
MEVEMAEKAAMEAEVQAGKKDKKDPKAKKKEAVKKPKPIARAETSKEQASTERLESLADGKKRKLDEQGNSAQGGKDSGRPADEKKNAEPGRRGPVEGERRKLRMRKLSILKLEPWNDKDDEELNPNSAQLLAMSLPRGIQNLDLQRG